MRRFGSRRSLSSNGLIPPRLLAVGPYAGYSAPLVSSLGNNQLVSGDIFAGSTVLNPYKYNILTLGNARISGDSDSWVYAAWANTINFTNGGSPGTFDLSGYPGGDAFQPCGVEGGQGGDKSAGGGAAYFPFCCPCLNVTLFGGSAGVEATHGSLEPGNPGDQLGCGASGGAGGSAASISSTVQSNSWAFQNGADGSNTAFSSGSPGIKLIGGSGAGGSVVVTCGLAFPAGSGGGGGGGAGGVLVARFITGDGTAGLSSEGGSGGSSTNCEGEFGGSGGGGAIDILAKNYIAGSIGFTNGPLIRLFEIRADNSVNMTPRSISDSWANG